MNIAQVIYLRSSTGIIPAPWAPSFDALRAEANATPLTYWDFQEPSGPFLGQGQVPTRLYERGSSVQRCMGANEQRYISIIQGQWLSVGLPEAANLGIYAPKTELTLIAWFKRARKNEPECEFIAGMWNETLSQRQYGLFLNLSIHESAEQVAGHVSGLGGPTPGHRWCMDAAIGQTIVTHDLWHCAALRYDGHNVSVFLNGSLDKRDELNPYSYRMGLFASRADFTVGGVHRMGQMGNWFCGSLAGLAIFNQALSDKQLSKLTQPRIS